MPTDLSNSGTPLVGAKHLTSGASVVQKSAPLLSLWRSPLTLAEFKVLDAYLARIDSHNPGQRWVRFSKGEVEDLLGVERINIQDLKAHLNHLMIAVDVHDLDEATGFRSVALFEEAVCRRDARGLWQVDLQCTAKAMKYVFNVENLGYLRYKLHSIINLTSRYSYLLFLYLERNRFRGDWTVSVEELREHLGCDQSRYQAFKYFNRDVLKRCKAELEAKTPCRFTYEPLKEGRSINAVRFVIDPYDAEADEPEALPASAEPSSREDAVIGILKTACLLPNGVPEFSTAEIKHLRTVLIHVPSSKMPQVSPALDSAFCQRQYLAERYAAMNRHAERKPIQHRFNYLLRMIKRDAGIE